jgi:hypothetical protein
MLWCFVEKLFFFPCLATSHFPFVYLHDGSHMRRYKKSYSTTSRFESLVGSNKPLCYIYNSSLSCFGRVGLDRHGVGYMSIPISACTTRTVSLFSLQVYSSGTLPRRSICAVLSELACKIKPCVQHGVMLLFQVPFILTTLFRSWFD